MVNAEIINENIYVNNLKFNIYLRNKKIYIWGAGKYSDNIVSLLSGFNIFDFSYIDKDEKKYQKKVWKNKFIYPPQFVFRDNKDDVFVIIGTLYFREIEEYLVAEGLQKWKDYINGVYWEDECYLLKHRNAPIMKSLDTLELNKICWIMKKKKIHTNQISIEEEKFSAFLKRLCFSEYYDEKNNLAYRRKMMEYYIAFYYLGLSDYIQNDIYLDIGASDSPWVTYLRKNYQFCSYGIDYQASKLNLQYYLQMDATNMEFKDNSVRGMSLQSAYCLFDGNKDELFIDECSRVLRKGGRVIIAPLYISKKYISAVSPKYYGKGYNDIGQDEYLRLDSYNISMARYYDVDHLKERVLDRIEKNRMTYKVLVLPNEQMPPSGFAYLKFVLLIDK